MQIVELERKAVESDIFGSHEDNNLAAGMLYHLHVLYVNVN